MRFHAEVSCGAGWLVGSTCEWLTASNFLSPRPALLFRRQPRQVLRQQVVTLAAAESEVEEEPVAEAKPRRAGGRGPRKPKPGPAQTMKVDELTVGQEYSGAVVSVTDFGAFVNVGCDVDGLLHISQISNDFVKNVADAVSIGQDISVRVLSVDMEKKKFSLTAKTGEAASGGGEKPRQARVRKERKAKPQIPVSAGDSITGKIASVASFGLFIEVGNGFQGMLHSSQMKLPEGVEDHFTHFKEGDEVEARVASINREKISLTQLTEEEARAQKEIETKGLATGTWSSCCVVF
jgi:predicted RNA-binding protein with RPS1 domain